MSIVTHTTFYYSLILLLPLVYYLWKRASRVSAPFPPGPKPLPIIGNLLDMPTKFPWNTYAKWATESGSDIVHAAIAGNHIIVLNTYEAAVDLLEKRSAIYSDRIRLPMVGELMGWGWDLGFLKYGDRWRAQRRLSNVCFSQQNFAVLEPRILRAARDLLLRLTDSPGDMLARLRYNATELILAISYGLDLSGEDDPIFIHLNKSLDSFREAFVPGAFLDTLPWLKYVPSWFPGAGFQRKAKISRRFSEWMVTEPFDMGKRKIDTGRFEPSLISHALESLREESSRTYYGEKDLSELAASMFIAGSETTAATLSTLILALLLNPDVQIKAQDEIDRVLQGELPALKDHDSLPYVTATVLEALRWNVVGPLGFPHRLMADDVYQGLLLPAGSMVFANIWSMMQDETIYPNPTSFQPDRFLTDGKLNPNIRDPRSAVFGFGRRICAGKRVAYASIWITAASLLATMHVANARDEKGKAIKVKAEYDGNMLNMPVPFPCSFKFRSAQTEAIVRAAVVDHPSE